MQNCKEPIYGQGQVDAIIVTFKMAYNRLGAYCFNFHYITVMVLLKILEIQGKRL